MFRKLLIACLCRLSHPPGHWEVKAAREFAKFDLALGVAVVTLALIFVSGYFASIVESLLIQVFNGTFLIAAIPVGVMMFLREGPLMVAPTPPHALVLPCSDCAGHRCMRLSAGSRLSHPCVGDELDMI